MFGLDLSRPGKNAQTKFQTFPGVDEAAGLTCAAGAALADRISQVTVTDEGALGVLTVPAQTDVWVQLALVHVCRKRGNQQNFNQDKAAWEFTNLLLILSAAESQIKTSPRSLARP